MVNNEELIKIIGDEKLAKETIRQIIGHINYLKLPYHQKEDAIDFFLNDEKTKIAFVDKIEKILFPLKDKLVLDVGCGKGGVVIACAKRGAKVTGFDIDKNELKIAQLRVKRLNHNKRVLIFKANAEDVPFPDNSFDLVTATAVLEHVNNPRNVIKEMTRVIKEGGFCAITFPNSLFPREGHYKIFWIPYLPKKLGEFYLKLRGFNPDFFIKNVFYVSMHKIIKILNQEGMEVENITKRDILTKFRSPELVKTTNYKKIIHYLKKLKINNLIARLIVLFHFYPSTFIIAKKKPKNQNLFPVSLKTYNNIDVELYETRHERIAREVYLKEHWQPLIQEAIKKYCKDKIVLDLGCGTGVYTAFIKKYTNQVIGIDVSEKMLNYAKNKYKNLRFILADAHNIPLEAESVDTVVSIGLFEYVQKETVLKEIHRILKPGGISIILVPNKYSAVRMPVKVFCRFLKRKYFPKEPSFKEMVNLFNQTRFKVLESKMKDGLMWLPDFLDRLIGGKIYLFIEKIFGVFGKNPFSNCILFITRKIS